MLKDKTLHIYVWLLSNNYMAKRNIFRHTEFISASLRLKKVLKQVQDDAVIFRPL